MTADPRIVAELEQIRRVNARFPPPKRPRIIYDYGHNKIVIAEMPR